MPFLDDIPIKGCPVEEKDETIGPAGCPRFVATHIDDCEKVLQRLEDARLTFSGEKSAFGKSEIMVVDHLSDRMAGNRLRLRWKPSPQ